MNSKIIEKIFIEIEDAIERTKSSKPVTIEQSRFLKELKKIKEKYLNENN